MASDTSRSPRTVPVQYVAAALAVTLAALVVLAVTPLGGVLLSASGAVVLRALFLGWLALALVVDVKSWGRYNRSRRRFAFAVWFVLGMGAISGFLVG